jgi:hypothetical protein
MAKKLQTPCAAPKRGIPWELKYDFAMRGWASNHRGFLYTVREEYGPVAALELFEKAQNIEDRVKILTDTIRTIFNLKGNDCETIGEVLDIWDQFTGTEFTILERSKTINRMKVTQCPFKTGYKDISEWSLALFDIISKTINSNASLAKPKAMCAKDSFCEYVWKIGENIPIKGAVETMAKKIEIPWDLKYNFAMKGWASNHRGWLYAIREKYGADIAVKMYARLCHMGDRIKNFTNTIRTIFKIEGNDADTIGKWHDIWWELSGTEYTILERSKTIHRAKITKCPWKTEPKDISNFSLSFENIAVKTINPKANVERPKGMCDGDPYCEYIHKIEE